MFSIKNHIILAVLFLNFFIGFSQEKETKKLIPISIYTNIDKTADLNGVYHINKKLNLTTYKFKLLNTRSIEEGYFNIPFYSINKTPTKYIYDSYNKIYRNLQMQKGSFKLSDIYLPRNVKNL